MAAKIRKTYLELASHNPFQIVVFVLIMASMALLILNNLLPLLEYFFEEYLNGRVINNGETVSYYTDGEEPLKETSYYFSWAVDVYVKTPQEARYWFNPVLSVSLQSLVLSLLITTLVTTLLPRKIGYFRQKIDREIASSLEKICFARNGYQDSRAVEELKAEFINASLQDLQDMEDELKIPMDKLAILRKALIWQKGSIFFKIFNFNDGIKIYMRFYFTVHYGNLVLGYVYIGAAILIIIIGLRGLKFIPPTQPSLVLFSLGLEFSFLVMYAITTIYTKEDESHGKELKPELKSSQMQALSEDFGDSKEVEKLLRVFIRGPKKE